MGAEITVVETDTDDSTEDAATATAVEAAVSAAVAATVATVEAESVVESKEEAEVAAAIAHDDAVTAVHMANDAAESAATAEVSLAQIRDLISEIPTRVAEGVIAAQQTPQETETVESAPVIVDEEAPSGGNWLTRAWFGR